MLTKDGIDEEKIMGMGRQIILGIGVVFFCCLILWQIGVFDNDVNDVADKKPIPKTQSEIYLELQAEQTKELKAIRIAIEKLAK